MRSTMEFTNLPTMIVSIAAVVLSYDYDFKFSSNLKCVYSGERSSEGEKVGNIS